MSTPTREHECIHRLVGTWSYEVEFEGGPDQPPSLEHGREVVRSLEGLWIIAEGVTQAGSGGTQTFVMTLGFDPAKGRIVGTSIGMGMPNLWVYDGEFAEAGRVLLLESEGPSFDGGAGTTRYRDRIDIIDEQTRETQYFYADATGAWQRFMRSSYTRIF